MVGFKSPVEGIYQEVVFGPRAPAGPCQIIHTATPAFSDPVDFNPGDTHPRFVASGQAVDIGHFGRPDGTNSTSIRHIDHSIPALVATYSILIRPGSTYGAIDSSDAIYLLQNPGGILPVRDISRNGVSIGTSNGATWGSTSTLWWHPIDDELWMFTSGIFGNPTSPAPQFTQMINITTGSTISTPFATNLSQVRHATLHPDGGFWFVCPQRGVAYHGPLGTHFLAASGLPKTGPIHFIRPNGNIHTGFAGGNGNLYSVDAGGITDLGSTCEFPWTVDPLTEVQIGNCSIQPAADFQTASYNASGSRDVSAIGYVDLTQSFT